MSVLPPGQARIFREVATRCPLLADTSMQRLILCSRVLCVHAFPLLCSQCRLLVRDVVLPPLLIDAAVGRRHGAVCSTVRPVGRAALLLFGPHLEGAVVEAL